jgi:hypothetical protein
MQGSISILNVQLRVPETDSQLLEDKKTSSALHAPAAILEEDATVSSRTALSEDVHDLGGRTNEGRRSLDVFISLRTSKDISNFIVFFLSCHDI